jgi:hypothetical protein
VGGSARGSGWLRPMRSGRTIAGRSPSSGRRDAGGGTAGWDMGGCWLTTTARPPHAAAGTARSTP